MKPWIIISGITSLIALGVFFAKPRDLPWATRLDRPRWLFFEPAIPFIWMVIFACGAWSAVLVWQQAPGSLKTWLLMGLYLFLEIVTVAYIPATLRLRSLGVGTFLGSLGMVLGIVLLLVVWQIANLAALLLMPYILWSPLTYFGVQLEPILPDARSI